MINELDVVALTRAFPEFGLTAGALGTVVEVYTEVDLEVEFVAKDGTTDALLTLKLADIRPVSPEDLRARALAR